MMQHPLTADGLKGDRGVGGREVGRAENKGYMDGSGLFPGFRYRIAGNLFMWSRDDQLALGL